MIRFVQSCRRARTPEGMRAEPAGHAPAGAPDGLDTQGCVFGIPIVESLWLGRPSLCASDDVMAQLAAGGGCLTVDMTDPAAISNAMERLAVDDDLHVRLCREATSRDLSSWDGYARRIGDALDGLGNVHASRSADARFDGAGNGRQRACLEQILDGAPLVPQPFTDGSHQGTAQARAGLAATVAVGRSRQGHRLHPAQPEAEPEHPCSRRNGAILPRDRQSRHHDALQASHVADHLQIGNVRGGDVERDPE